MLDQIAANFPEFFNLMLEVAMLANMPFNDPELLWTVFPLFTSTLIIELYFGSHKEEELGWNSATANGLVLVVVGSNTIRYLYSKAMFDMAMIESRVAIAIVGIGLLLSFISFFHILPKEFAFMISSGLVVHYLAYLGVLTVYSGIVFQGITAFAALALFIMLAIIFKLIKHFEPDLY